MMKSNSPRRDAARIAATLLTGLLIAAEPVFADVIWAPMWDIRTLPMRWEVKATGAVTTFHSHWADAGTFKVYNSSNVELASSIGGAGSDTSVAVATTPGDVYFMDYIAGFHVRPHWDGIDWARLGPGAQGAGPGSNIGFQSDAELGFDIARFGDLGALFANTTWFYNVGVGEGLSLSVEHVTGDPAGAKKFEWVSPSAVITLADPDGIPGVGGAHWPARGGVYTAAPDPLSPQWEEYVAAVAGEDGFWGFRLTAKDGIFSPYAWHYILDRTDAGADQYAYLLEGSIRDPNAPEPGILGLLGVGLAGALIGRRRKSRT